MPQVSLAEYRHRIVEQIENGHIDAAIAHCRHVLTHHPRYLSAYKLLAHACLEKGDFSHANHFFQCVLSADLEDADAWINLALLAEDLGETRQAIWLLERAFEVAPGNTRVRELLRQLYVQRDGAERTRIKLTPTALARLYAKGGFYRRAIRELEKMLQESANLPRLQVATLEASLAQALWNTEDMTSLADRVCQSLLDKVPLSLQANLILGEIRSSAGRHQESESYLGLARMLDPEGELAYELLGHRSPLPLQEVKIPYLAYQAPTVQEAQTAVPEIEDTSWLDRIGESVAPLDMEDERQVPEWIKNWTETEALVPTTADQEPLSADSSETELENAPLGDESLQDAIDVPDWLLSVQRESAIPDTDQDVSDWLQELPGNAEDESDLTTAEQIPDWIQELGAQNQAEPSPQTEAQPTLQDNLPDWLFEPSQTKPEQADAPLAASDDEWADSNQEQADLRDQIQAEKTTRPLRAPTLVGDTSQPKEAKELPQWFDELRQEAETATSGEPEKETVPVPAAEPTSHDETPDWLRALSDESQTETPDTPTPEPAAPTAPLAAAAASQEQPSTESAEEDLPNWLRELEAEISGVESPAPVAQALPTEAPAMPPLAAPSEPLEPAALAAEGLAEAEQPDWLVKLDETTALDEPEEALLEPTPVDEIPDWLHELERADETAESVPPAFDLLEPDAEAEPDGVPGAEIEPLPDEELPDWLLELRAESEFAETVTAADQEAVDLSFEEESVLEPTPEKELPDWLQQLRPAKEPQTEQVLHLAEEPEPILAAKPAESELEPIEETLPAPSDEIDDMEWLRELEEATIVAAPQPEPEPVGPIAPTTRAPETEQVIEEPTIASVVPPTPAPTTAPLKPIIVTRPSKEAPVPQEQDTETHLALARARLAENVLDESAQEYERLVQEPDLAGDLIEELEEAVLSHPEHHALQRVLGDAYMRTGKLQKALAAYRQALTKL